MNVLAAVVTALVGLIHVGFAVVEIGFWMKPIPIPIPIEGANEPACYKLGFKVPDSEIPPQDAPQGEKDAYQAKVKEMELRAKMAKPIVKNAGIYNSFIAAGLFWAAFLAWRGGAGSPDAFCIQTFFLVCVMIAGIFGAFTLKPEFDWVTIKAQTAPALVAWVLCWRAKSPAA